MWYLIGFMTLIIWTLCLFSGLIFDGWIHVLLAVAVISVIAAVIRDQRELMP